MCQILLTGPLLTDQAAYDLHQNLPHHTSHSTAESFNDPIVLIPNCKAAKSRVATQNQRYKKQELRNYLSKLCLSTPELAVPLLSELLIGTHFAHCKTQSYEILSILHTSTVKVSPERRTPCRDVVGQLRKSFSQLLEGLNVASDLAVSLSAEQYRVLKTTMLVEAL